MRGSDPFYERAYLANPDGEYEIGEAFLTISLGEPYEGACYKLIALSFSLERRRGHHAGRAVLTIGHSNHSLDTFASGHGSARTDVRSAPYSRFNPQFNRESLKDGTSRNIGRELGRSDDGKGKPRHGGPRTRGPRGKEIPCRADVCGEGAARMPPHHPRRSQIILCERWSRTKKRWTGLCAWPTPEN